MNENKTIMKPATLLKEEFMENLTMLCNNAGLPFFYIESILKEFIQDVHIASKRQYESDKIRYEQELIKLQQSSSEESGV